MDKYKGNNLSEDHRWDGSQLWRDKETSDRGQGIGENGALKSLQVERIGVVGGMETKALHRWEMMEPEGCDEDKSYDECL